MATPNKIFKVPFKEKLIGLNGLLSRSWEDFFSLLETLLGTLGSEKYFIIENDISVAANIEGLSFNSGVVSQAIVDFLIQRVTTGVGAVELIESGTFHVVYRPVSEDWDILFMGTPGPDDSGVDFSITADGQVKYISTDETGTPSISKLTYRTRTMSGKNYQYSVQGGR